MTPDPYLRNMAIVLAVVLAAAGLLGVTVIAAVGAGLNLVIWGLLRSAYAKRRSAWPIEAAYGATEAAAVRDAVRERARLDRLVDRSAISATLVGAIAFGIGLLIGTDPPGQLAAHAAGVALLIGSGGVFWSSLVDWFWTLPRISGLVGHRACRLQPEPGGRPESWEEVTRWWIVHRIAAVVAVAVAAGGVVGTLAGLGAHGLDATPAIQGMVGILSGVVVTFAEVYRKKAADGLPLLLHPEILVGESYTDGVSGPCFPVDVAMEGFKVVRRDAQNERYLAFRTQKKSRFLRAKGDETVPLADAQARRKGSADVYCSSCLGLNWYCVENPHAWDKGPRTAPRPDPEQSAPAT